MLTDADVVAAPPALVHAGLETLPVAIATAAHTSERFVEFFTANIRNQNTRMAYALAVRQFFDWCEQRTFALDASGQRPWPPTLNSSESRCPSRRSNSIWPPSGNFSTTWLPACLKSNTAG